MSEEGHTLWVSLLEDDWKLILALDSDSSSTSSLTGGTNNNLHMQEYS
jgi:hypothetical protein